MVSSPRPLGPSARGTKIVHSRLRPHVASWPPARYAMFRVSRERSRGGLAAPVAAGAASVTAIVVLCVPAPDGLRRYPGDDRAGGNIFGDDAAGADRRPAADAHALEHDHTGAKPDKIFEDDGPRSGAGQRFAGDVEVVVHDEHARADLAAASDRHRLASRDRDAGVDEGAVTDLERSAT